MKLAGKTDVGRVRRDILPDDCHQVTIAKDLEKGFDFREITLDEMR